LGRAPDVSYYCVNKIHESYRKDFLSWYEAVAQKEVFDKMRVPERSCQDDVRVLLDVNLTFHRRILQIRNVDVFLESINIA
jgi:hypothetical protein